MGKKTPLAHARSGLTTESRFWPSRRVTGLVLLVGACTFLCTAGLVSVAFLLDPDAAEVVKRLPRRAVYASANALRKWTADRVAPDRLSILIDDVDFERIRADRRRALEERFNISDENAWVPARVVHGDETVKVRMRLKGALPDHWSGPDQWSFLIKVRGDDSLKRMKRFSIQHPSTRSFIHEWLFLRALEDEGLIALRFEFVEVDINGEKRDLYALEEQPGKLLIENNSLRGGPVIGFNKSDWLAYWIAHGEHARLGHPNLGNPDPSWFFRAAPIEATQSGSVSPGSAEERLHIAAMSLLEAFRSGERSASEVFAGDEMARLAALCAVLGGLELDWRDLKFYYNPITARLHPIGKELHFNREIGAHRWWTNDGERPHGAPLPKLLFADGEFEQTYLRQLDRLSRTEWLEDFLARHEEDREHNLAILAGHFPGYSFSREDLRAIGNVIRNTLRPPRLVNAYFAGLHDGKMHFEVGNLSPFSVSVLGVRLPGGERLPVGEAVVLGGRKMDDVVSHSTVRLDVPAGWSEEAASELRIAVQVRGLEPERLDPVFRWPRSVQTGLDSDLVRELPASVARPFLAVAEQSDEIHCLPGDWVIYEPVIIPRGYRLLGCPGVRWDLRDSAFVLSHSPVELVGSEDDPFVIESSDSSGGGLVVINAGEWSKLEHVVASGLSAPERSGWSLTGAITFYDSPVHISHAFFADNRAGDDLLNLVRSDFRLEQSGFLRTAADALDIDYSRGDVSDTSFRDVGGDALDLCGSHVEVTRVSVTGAGDKGMSFGEQSRVSVFDSKISAARIGLACKDGSRVHVESLEINDSEYGLVVFRKKPEFGPGHVEATGLRQRGNRTESLIEDGSTLIINGKQHATEFKNVARMLDP